MSRRIVEVGVATRGAFIDLWIDALFLLRQSRGASGVFEQNRYGRMAVLAAAASIEGAANCLMEQMKGPKHFLNELDRLPALVKIESFLSFGYGLP